MFAFWVGIFRVSGEHLPNSWSPSPLVEMMKRTQKTETETFSHVNYIGYPPVLCLTKHTCMCVYYAIEDGSVLIMWLHSWDWEDSWKPITCISCQRLYPPVMCPTVQLQDPFCMVFCVDVATKFGPGSMSC